MVGGRVGLDGKMRRIIIERLNFFIVKKKKKLHHVCFNVPNKVYFTFSKLIKYSYVFNNKFIEITYVLIILKSNVLLIEIFSIH